MRCGVELAAVALLACGCGSSLSCPVSIEAQCASSPCAETLDEVVPKLCPSRLIQVQCGAFVEVSEAGIDTANELFYDASSGKLVAIVFFSANTSSHTCTAGPSTFDLPTCAGPGAQVSCPGG